MEKGGGEQNRRVSQSIEGLSSWSVIHSLLILVLSASILNWQVIRMIFDPLLSSSLTSSRYGREKERRQRILQDTVVLIDNLFSLQYTHTSRGGASVCPSMETSLVVPFVPSNLQQQENHYDCGLYVLEYARRFLLNPPKKVRYLISLGVRQMRIRWN